MNTEFQKITKKMEPLLDELLASPKMTLDQLREVPDKGVYIFYENDKPVYVGRSNRVRNRIKEHGADSSGHESATFALKLLRKDLNDPGGHSPKYSRKTIVDCPELNQQFAEKRKLVQEMQFQVVAISDHPTQYIFEAYAIISLGTTEFNSFETT